MLTNDQTVTKYIDNVKSMNPSTAKQYYIRLNDFDRFVSFEYKSSIKDLIKDINEGSVDPYDVLSNYIRYLQNKENHIVMSAITLKQRVVTAKNFLEYNDIEISPRKFKLKVKVPKVIRKNIQALSKEDIINILNSISDIRLKTYVMLLAATGMRASEALSIRIIDCDFNANPARIFIRGEYTKTKTNRVVLLTNEVSKQLQLLIDYKYRTRRVSYFDRSKEKILTEYRTPVKNEEDLIFAVYQTNTDRNSSEGISNIYVGLVRPFEETLDRIHMGKNQELKANNNHNNKNIYKRREITLHSFRRYVKSTISDLGYGDFSEYFIGHIGSTYYRKTEKEKEDLFRKIEPYLTYLDYTTLERKGADVQSKVEEIEMENQILRQRDSINKDVLATLSDQVMKLMVEVQELKHQR